MKINRAADIFKLINYYISYTPNGNKFWNVTLFSIWLFNFQATADQQAVNRKTQSSQGGKGISSAYDNRRGSVIVETDEGVLLVSSSGSYYRLPGGKPKKGEASIEAAIRELREETGLLAYNVKYLFKFHASKVFKIEAKGKPEPRSEIHYFAFFRPGKNMEVRVSDNTLKLLDIYYELKERT